MKGALSDLAAKEAQSTVARVEIAEGVFRSQSRSASEDAVDTDLLNAFRDFWVLWQGYGGTASILYRPSNENSVSRARAITTECVGVER